MDLLSFSDAVKIERQLPSTVLFVEVIDGKHKGSFGQIIDVYAERFNKQKYLVDMGEKRNVFSADCLLLTDEERYCFRNNSNFVKSFIDMNGRDIDVGQTVVYSRPQHETRAVSGLIMGRVSCITHNSIIVDTISANGNFTLGGSATLRKTDSLMVLDSQTLPAAMMNKLSSKAN